MTSENEISYMFPACNYMLGLGGKKANDENNIVAFENVLEEQNKDLIRGLLLIKVNNESADQEAMLITPQPFTDGQDGLQFGNKKVSFEDSHMKLEEQIFEYKNMEIAYTVDKTTKEHKSILVTKDEKKEIIQLNTKVIEFFQMNYMARTIKIVIANSELALSQVNIQNVTPVLASVDWTEKVIYEEGVHFENADIKNYTEPENDSEGVEKSKWISENSFLFKDGIKYKLADCQLAQSNNKLYIVIRQQNKDDDDILLGYVIPAASLTETKNKNQTLESINEDVVNEI